MSRIWFKITQFGGGGATRNKTDRLWVNNCQSWVTNIWRFSILLTLYVFHNKKIFFKNEVIQCNIKTLLPKHYNFQLWQKTCYVFCCLYSCLLGCFQSHPKQDFKLEMMVRLCRKILRKCRKQRGYFASCVLMRDGCKSKQCKVE